MSVQPFKVQTQATLDDLRDRLARSWTDEVAVMVELGVAIALNKAIFLFRDDFRRCTDSEQYPLNLMLFCGLPEVGWEDYYYTPIDEIKSQDKALYGWL